MTEEQAAARLMRDQALADCDEFLAWVRATRQEGAGQAEWQPVAPEQPKPVRRAPEPRQGPAPPLPDKLQRPRHGPDGRIQSIESYEGATAVRAVMGWEKFVADTVAHAVAAERKAARERLLDALDVLGAEI